ncbi:hypothetical protein HDV57DRAFT_480321 [Trichoderma longibrachiatum]
MLMFFLAGIELNLSMMILAAFLVTFLNLTAVGFPFAMKREMHCWHIANHDRSLPWTCSICNTSIIMRQWPNRTLQKSQHMPSEVQRRTPNCCTMTQKST